MIKAIRVHQYGGPEVLNYEMIAEKALNAGEVLVKNHAIGLNFLDTYYRTGAYKAPQLPFVPGSEAAGTVLAVGPGVSEFVEGDRVAYVSRLGAYSERCVVPAEMLVRLVDEISFAQAASVMLKGLTAEYLLHRTYKVTPGDVILVHAAAGATGQILVQWAKQLGASVIATVGSDEKATIAKRCGADCVINYAQSDFAIEVKRWTQGAMCDVVYDGVGRTTFLKSLDCLKPFGLFVSFGNSSGPIDAFNLNTLRNNGSLYMTRPTLFSHITKRKTLISMAQNLFCVIGAGHLTVDVRHKFALRDAARAQRSLERRETTGPSVLLP